MLIIANLGHNCNSGQQSRVVKIHTDLKVGEYYGAKNVDNWGSAEWETQISDVEVCFFSDCFSFFPGFC